MSRYLIFFWLLISCMPVFSSPFPEQASIYLQRTDGSEISIGTITFTTANSDKTSFVVDIDNNAFTEHFLSMRPFRCLEDSKEWFCYLPYPYDLRGLVTIDDLSDLEYSLLFIKKSPAEFGIDAWNGLYYKLSLESDRTLTGVLFEGDLNSLQSPPAEMYAKPVDLGEFIPGNKKQRLFPSLRIY